MKANDPESESQSSAPLPPPSGPPTNIGPAEAATFFSDEEFAVNVNYDVNLHSDTMSRDRQATAEAESAEQIALVIPFPFDSYGRVEWRLPIEVEESLPWEDNARRLRTSAGVLDLAGFLHLRDRVGAWIECDQRNREVAEALRPLCAVDWGEPGGPASTETPTR